MRALGADTVIDTAVVDDVVARAFIEAKGEGYDVVVDFLWTADRDFVRTLVPELFTRDPGALAES